MRNLYKQLTKGYAFLWHMCNSCSLLSVIGYEYFRLDGCLWQNSKNMIDKNQSS